MNEQIKEYDEKMKKTVDFLKEDLQSIRAGRANPHVLDKLRVNYYGTPTPIQQVANVSVPELVLSRSVPGTRASLRRLTRQSSLRISASHRSRMLRPSALFSRN